MNRIKYITAGAIFTALFAVSAFAQGGNAVTTTKIGWIITAAFGDDKEGITKYVNAEKALDAEMKPRLTELQTLQTRMQALSEEIKKMSGNPAVPVDQKTIAAKQDEGQRLQREYEFKQKEAQASYGKRREEVMAPISTNIFQALQEYAKKNGYTAVIDISTLGAADQPSPLLFLEPAADITKAFIAYYNTRPATTASTTPARQP